MKICLIDADSTIPNLALMKLSTYYKNKEATVDLFQANLPYYPGKKKKLFYALKGYDKYFCSVIFEGNKKYIYGSGIEFGGSGCDLKKKLPKYIENLEPDYSLYPTNNISYGFISRGCIRNCSFCIVPKKEGKLKQVSTINKIVKHKKVKFLDNNFLALSNHKELLQELIDKKIKCNFNQGLDIRLLDKENSLLLSKLNYLGEYTFAFDDYKYLKNIKNKIKLLNWRKDYQIRFFVYCNPDMTIKNIVKRILWLKKNKFLPYLMRDKKCWNSKYKEFYIDLATYCNQVGIFKKMTFKSFMEKYGKRYKDKNRTIKNILLFEKIKNPKYIFPKIIENNLGMKAIFKK